MLLLLDIPHGLMVLRASGKRGTFLENLFINEKIFCLPSYFLVV
jgi:hypothetical protein